MAATYPGDVVNYTARQDIVDTIRAIDINSLQVEIVAIQDTLGHGTVSGSSLLYSVWDSTAFNPSTTVWGNLNSRLVNIERGLVNGVSTAPYLRKDGGTMSAASGSVTLTLKNASGNTVNLFEAKKTDDTVVFHIDKDGLPSVGINEVLYADSVNNVSYKAILDRLTAIELDQAQMVSPFLLNGM